MFDICIIGNICTDIFVKPLNRLPEKGQLVFLDSMKVEAGGCGLNPSIYLANMGFRTAILGKIGNDAFGDYIAKTLQHANVDISGLKRDNAMPTSATVVAIDEGGERTLMHYLGTNGTLNSKDIDMDVLDSTHLLFIGGAFLMPAFVGTDMARVLKSAKQKGLICALDTAWDARGKWMETLEPCLAYLDWFLPSYEEAVELSGSTDVARVARFFQEKGAKNVVIKLGAKGCGVFYGNKNGVYVEPLKDIEVKDSSGAGDAFCAGFLTGLIKGWEPVKCAEFGNTLGALCVTEVGAITAARPFQAVLEFRSKHGGYTLDG
jgi:sugar/nucleoside kinase (ribokinase family)